ncbi:hypothetical protein M885DRAFT_525050 [Pelagophyceae sp. CCMP2097]|nr:hypothetical protein M885DRAFT_525050 [Pelagophyceae sp. CCMP2097]
MPRYGWAALQAESRLGSSTAAQGRIEGTTNQRPSTKDDGHRRRCSRWLCCQRSVLAGMGMVRRKPSRVPEMGDAVNKPTQPSTNPRSLKGAVSRNPRERLATRGRFKRPLSSGPRDGAVFRRRFECPSPRAVLRRNSKSPSQFRGAVSTERGPFEEPSRGAVSSV